MPIITEITLIVALAAFLSIIAHWLKQPTIIGYIAIALTFSSTIIIIKLLSDKRELDTLYARIVVGLLLIQDLIAILALIILPGIVGDSQGNEGGVNWINLGMI